MPESNWKAATRQIELDAMVCIKCGAMNRPGLHYIVLLPSGHYDCSVCAKTWKAP